MSTETPDRPNPEAMDAGFGFAKQLRDPEFRAYIAAMGGRGLTVVATFTGEPADRLERRLRNVATRDGEERVLVVAVDETQRWGLRIDLVEVRRRPARYGQHRRGDRQMSARPTALLIPSPWSGDDNDPIPRSYHVWFRLYRRTRQLRHMLYLHDWRYGPDPRLTYCTWCGKRRHGV